VTLTALAIANLMGAHFGALDRKSVHRNQDRGAAADARRRVVLLHRRELLPSRRRSRSGRRRPKLGQAAASVIWAYDGWVAVSMITGEVVAAREADEADHHRGMLTIVGLYLVANVGYFYAMSLPAMAQAKEGCRRRSCIW